MNSVTFSCYQGARDQETTRSGLLRLSQEKEKGRGGDNMKLTTLLVQKSNDEILTFVSFSLSTVT